MPDKSITLRTVHAPPCMEGNEEITPQLHLTVGYTAGGTSMLTGSHFQRGYEISIRHDRHSDRGFTSIIIDGKGNPTAAIEPAARYSQKTFDRIVAEVHAGKHDQTIAHLYCKAVMNRSEYVWPESIFPLVSEAVGVQ